VYRADGTEYGTVAIKVPLEGADLDRFRVEKLVQAKLRHPNIVSALEVNRPGEPDYIVMEYIEAPTLRTVLAAHPGGLSPVAAARIAIGVCHGLAHAYTNAKLRAHRDIKPGNIFADVQGDTVGLVKLSDFGVVKRWDDGGGMGTRFLGAPHYMSPEQINASALVTELTDIYSLGCVLYEMAAGRPPFEGNPMQVMNDHLGKEPIPPSSLRPDLPEALNAAILRCLAKNPRHRFASVLDLAAALASDGSATRSTTARFVSALDLPGVPAPWPGDWPAPAPVPQEPRVRVEEPPTPATVRVLPHREASGYLEHLETDKVLGIAGGPADGYEGSTPASPEPPWGWQPSRETPAGILLAASMVGLVLYAAVILILILASSRAQGRPVPRRPPRAALPPGPPVAEKARVGIPILPPVPQPAVAPKAEEPPEPKAKEPAIKEPAPPEPKVEEPPAKEPVPPVPKAEEPPCERACAPRAEGRGAAPARAKGQGTTRQGAGAAPACQGIRAACAEGRGAAREGVAGPAAEDARAVGQGASGRSDRVCRAAHQGCRAGP